MKKILLILAFCLIACWLFSSCTGYSKNYEIVDEKIHYVNNVGLYIDFYEGIVKKKQDIQNESDHIYLSSIATNIATEIIINWYEIDLNGKLQKHENIKKRYEFEEESQKFYFDRHKIEEASLKSKAGDQITVRINVTLIADGKEETKTITNTFSVKVKIITKLDEWFSV